VSKEQLRVVVVGGGASACLAMAITGVVMMTYWHDLSGSWLDDRVLFWNPIVPAALIGVFIFTRFVDTFFE
jgi:hypothetical protein